MLSGVNHQNRHTRTSCVRDSIYIVDVHFGISQCPTNSTGLWDAIEQIRWLNNLEKIPNSSGEPL